MKNSVFKKVIKQSYDLLKYVENQRSRHFSFIVDKNTIISSAYNKMDKTDPLAAKFSRDYPFLHSEIGAIKSFPYKPSLLKEYVILNTRIDRNGNLNIARPCRRCQPLLRYFGVSQIYYTNEYGLFEKLAMPN